MKGKARHHLFLTIVFLLLFGIFTGAVMFFDVRPIGPEGSSVGLAGINGFVFKLFGGFNETIYKITEVLGLIPLAICGCFALLGLVQLIKRRSLAKVDGDIYVLGGFMVIVLAAYVLFDKVVINCRPVLIDGILEASYPSSHTLLACSVMSVTILQLNTRIKNRNLLSAAQIASAALMAAIVIGRLMAGEHWFTDIIGGVLLSVGFVELYSTAVACLKDPRHEKS